MFLFFYFILIFNVDRVLTWWVWVNGAGHGFWTGLVMGLSVLGFSNNKFMVFVLD